MNIDLKFWLKVYDKATQEQDMWIEQNNWFYEHIGSPYTFEEKKEMFELDSRIMKLNDIKEYITGRILKYNTQKELIETLELSYKELKILLNNSSSKPDPEKIQHIKTVLDKYK